MYVTEHSLFQSDVSLVGRIIMSNKNKDKSQNIEEFGYILSRMIQACQTERYLNSTRLSESLKKNQ